MLIYGCFGSWIIAVMIAVYLMVAIFVYGLFVYSIYDLLKNELALLKRKSKTEQITIKEDIYSTLINLIILLFIMCFWFFGIYQDGFFDGYCFNSQFINNPFSGINK